MLGFLNVFHAIYDSFPMSCKGILWTSPTPKVINCYHITQNDQLLSVIAHNDQLLSYHPKLSAVIISPTIISWYYHIAHNYQLVLSYHPKLSIIIISPIILSLSTDGFSSVIQFNFAHLLLSIDFKTSDKRFLKISLKLNLNKIYVWIDL